VLVSQADAEDMCRRMAREEGILRVCRTAGALVAQKPPNPSRMSWCSSSVIAVTKTVDWHLPGLEV
jgi:cysteine synthase